MNALHRHFPIARHANLANAITATNAILGVVGVHFATRGALLPALLCGALALPCDVLDGVVARRMGTSSKFGAQLDSLADAVSFCLLPASFASALRLPGYALVAAVLYALAGLLRLARFAEAGLSTAEGRDCFEGLPTSIGAAVALLVATIAIHVPEVTRAPLFTGFYLISAVAMVSSVPVPKAGLHTKLLWVLVPVALVIAWLRLR